MTSTPFMVKLTEAERATLESERARLGLRSMAEVIRHWIGNATEAGKASADAMLFGQGTVKITRVDPAVLTNAKGEPKELPKPRKAFKSRLKGHWSPP